jgi:hypothetical protein
LPASHVKADTIADATGTVTFWWGATTASAAATDQMRPSDWNSAHNQFFTLSGNTAGNSTASGTNIVLSAAGNFTLAGSTGTIVLSGPAPLSSYEPFVIQGGSTALVSTPTGTSASLSLFGFVIDDQVSVGVMNMMFSASFLTVGTSKGSQTLGLWVGLYTRGTGANSTTISVSVSQSFSLGVSGSNSTYTINQPTASNYTGYGTGSTTSAGSNISSGYTGGKIIGFPLNTLMSPGMYWLGLMITKSTSSVNIGISLSYVGPVAPGIFASLAPIGSASSAYSLGADPAGGQWYHGHGLWTSAGSVTGMPNTIAFTSISAGALTHPYLLFWST